MRIRKNDGQEKCTNCGTTWESYSDCPKLCNNCFCPETYCTLVDDIGWHQSGFIKELVGDPLSQGAIADLKTIVEEQIRNSVPPLTWQELCEKQPLAKRLFDS